MITTALVGVVGAVLVFVGCCLIIASGGKVRDEIVEDRD